MISDIGKMSSDAVYEMRMLEHNRLETLIPVRVRSINNHSVYYYDITSKQQFARMYEYRKMTRKNVESLIMSLDRMVNEINEYMLELDKVALQPECIYVDAARDKLLFAYAAGESSDEPMGFGQGLRRLFDCVIEHFDHGSDNDDICFVYNIYQRIAAGEYDASELKLLLEESVQPQDTLGEGEAIYDDHDPVLDFIPEEIVKEEEETPNKTAVMAVNIAKTILGLVLAAAAGRLLAPSYVPLPVSDVTAFVMVVAAAAGIAVLGKIPVKAMTTTKVSDIPQPYTYKDKEADLFDYGDSARKYVNSMPDAEKVNEEKLEPDYDNATVLLSDYLKQHNKNTLRLSYNGTEDVDDIEVTQVPWMIGSMDDKCNSIIKNRLVSHIHACITKLDDEYYIEDMNSTNGTYVNGERLIMNSRHKLADTDTVTLAAISYKVEMS